MEQAMKIATTQESGVELADRRDAWMRTQPRARSADSTVRFRRVSGRAGLLSIEHVWRRITAARPAIAHYQTYDWYRIYLDALEYRENDWHFFVVYQGYMPVGIVPLRQGKTTVRGVSLRALELPDHPHVPFADLIVPDLPTDAFTAAFMAYLRHSGLAWDALILRRIAADSPTLRLCAAGAPLTCAVPSRRRLLTPVQAGNADAQTRDNWARLGGHTEYVASDKPALHRLFKTFLHVEASGWRGHAGLRGAIRDDSRLVRYYRRLIDAFGDAGCEIRVLEFNAQPIAAEFCLLSNETRYVIKTGYDAAYAHLAPWRLLLDASLSQSTGEGRPFNLMAAAPWHHADIPSCATFDIHRFNATRPGLSAYARMRAGQIFHPGYRDYRRLRAVARGRLQEGIAQVSRAMDQYLRCP